VDSIDRIERGHPDNLMMTGYPLQARADVVRAFEGSGFELDPTCRVQYVDNGLLATCRAGDPNGEQEPWLLIAWGTLRLDERETWLAHWRQLEANR